jgi:hypothetical protein
MKSPQDTRARSFQSCNFNQPADRQRAIEFVLAREKLKIDRIRQYEKYLRSLSRERSKISDDQVCQHENKVKQANCFQRIR